MCLLGAHPMVGTVLCAFYHPGVRFMLCQMKQASDTLADAAFFEVEVSFCSHLCINRVQGSAGRAIMMDVVPCTSRGGG